MSSDSKQTLSHYRLLEKIGEGGMGVVWKAEDTILHRIVAIKVLPGNYARDEERRRMFLQEACLASSVSQAHIVQVHEFGHEGDLDFIVMEFVDGKPLRRILHGRPLPPDTVADIGLQIAQGLSQTHRRGLLHRDLKPANILVTRDGDAKLVDFGLAMLFASRDQQLSPDAPTQTDIEIPDTDFRTTPSSSVAGTLPYMSPEQIRGEDLDSRSDIFSLGVILYEMTTGQRPFIAVNRRDLVDEILKARPKPVHELVPRVPIDLDKIIQKAVSGRPSDRYQTMDDLAVDLKRLGRELESGSSPSYQELGKSVQLFTRQRIMRIALAGLLVMATISLGTWGTIRYLASRVDPRTILILPMQIRGQTEGADYVGLAFAEMIAVTLSQSRNLNVLPVPEIRLGGDDAPSARARAARRERAGRLLTGALTREGDVVHATLNLIDSTRNRIMWGAKKDGGDQDLADIASAFGEELANFLGGTREYLYDSIDKLTGDAEMAASPETSKAVGALIHEKVQPALQATEGLVAQFPDKLAAWVLRAEALQMAWQFDRTPERKSSYKKGLLILERLDPGNPYQSLLRARDHLLEGRPNEAMAGYAELQEREDLTAGFRFSVEKRIAWTKWELGDYDDALREAEEARAYNPMNDETYSLLSLILRSMEPPDHEAALDRARQAVSLNPSKTWNNMEVADNLAALGRNEEAVRYSSKSCEIGGDSGNCGAHAGHLQRAGKTAEALAIARKAEAMTESLSGAYNIAGYWALAGNAGKAMHFLKRARELGMADDFLASDSTFDSLHGDPTFDSLLAEIQKEIRK